MNTINIQGQILSLNSPLVMGILNLTPDSFYNQSRIINASDLVNMAAKMLEEGATILDLGAYSSRPGAEDISEDTELQRLLPAVEALRKEFPKAILSIDTFRAKVAQEAGADLINDISAGTLDANMFLTAAKMQVPYLLMHMRGTPQTMANMTNYEHLLAHLLQYFSSKIEELRTLGVKDILIDPGFGFAKTTSQNFEILNNLQILNALNCPILAGVSRKSMITKTLDVAAADALNGTTALNMVALMNGAKILRVHDVKEAHQTIQLYKALKHDA